MARSSDSNFLLSLLRDKTFQAQEIRRVIVLSMIYLGITTVLVGAFYHQMLGRMIDGMAPLLFVSEDIAMADDALPAMSEVLGQWMLAMLAVNVLVTISIAVFIARKLGHPVMAIKRALREIGNGNLDVRLRSSDKSEFGEICAELTTAMHTINAQISAAKNSMAQARTLQENSETKSQSDDVDILLTNCQSALDFFQVEGPESGLKLIDDGDGESKVA